MIKEKDHFNIRTYKRLREIREGLELKVKYTAEDIGYTAPTLSTIENGYKLPSLHIVASLAEYYEFSLDTLLLAEDKEFYKALHERVLEENAIYVSKEIKQNIVLSEVQELLEVQTLKGIEKYGTTVDTDSLHVSEWIGHAQEEIVDMLVYLTTLKSKLSEDGLK